MQAVFRQTWLPEQPFLRLLNTTVTTALSHLADSWEAAAAAAATARDSPGSDGDGDDIADGSSSAASEPPGSGTNGTATNTTTTISGTNGTANASMVPALRQLAVEAAQQVAANLAGLISTLADTTSQQRGPLGAAALSALNSSMAALANRFEVSEY